MNEQREVFFTGRVQGVGFRFTTCRLAKQFNVSGFVRNLPDGRVHLVVEGNRDAINGMLAAITRTMCSHIAALDQKHGEATGEYNCFEITHF